jgi:hypothetical protein
LAGGELVVAHPLLEPITVVDQCDGRIALLGDELGCGDAGVACAQDHDMGCCLAAVGHRDSFVFMGAPI